VALKGVGPALASPMYARGLLLTLGSALLYALSFPPAHLYPFAWVALVPFLVVLREAGTLATALVLATVWALGVAVGVASWLPGAVATYYLQPRAVGVTLFLGVASVLFAPAYLAFAAWRRYCRGAPSVCAPLLVAAGWVAAEFARGRLVSGNPWALLGYSQTGVLPLMQVAEVTGIYGVSFVAAAANAALAQLWGTRRDAPKRRAALAGMALTAVTAALIAAYGAARLRTGPPGTEEPAIPAPVGVAVVQGNFRVGAQWRPEVAPRQLAVYLDLTRTAVQAHHPALVVWPESAMTFFVAQEPRRRQAIGRVIAAAGSELVAGGPRVSAGSPPSIHNAAFLLDSTGAIRAWYDKERLLPFGEYFPLRSVALLRRHFGPVREFAAGDPTPPLPTAAGRAGVAICNEAMFPELLRARVRAGAEVLLTLTNDTWLGSVQFARMHADVARWRAVEQRRFLVRASTSGPSVIVDPWGRVLEESPLGTATVLAGTVTPRSGLTVYGRVGDAFAWACVAVAFAAAVPVGPGRRGAPADNPGGDEPAPLAPRARFRP
jgi:apolipoprotein N-acyltransferase